MRVKKKILFFGASRSTRNSRLQLLQKLKKKYDLIVYLRTKDTRTEKLLNHKKIKLYSNTFSKNAFSSNFIFDIFFLIRLVLLEKPDIIFSFNTIPNILNLILKIIFKRTISIFLITGLGSFFNTEIKKVNFKFFMLTILVKNIINYSNFIIFQNKDDKVFFKKVNKNKKFCYLIVNGSGVDLQKFKCKNTVNNSTIILMISRIIKEKGVNEFLNAANKIKSKYPYYVFTLIGNLENNKYLNNKIKNYQSRKIIKYLEFTENIKSKIKKASVVVLPTYYGEGVPRVLLESMSMYKPIITTKMPGCKETINNGVNGFFVKKKSSKDLANKILLITSSKSKLKKMGYESHKIAKKKFDINTVTRQIEEYLDYNV